LRGSVSLGGYNPEASHSEKLRKKSRREKGPRGESFKKKVEEVKPPVYEGPRREKGYPFKTELALQRIPTKREERKTGKEENPATKKGEVNGISEMKRTKWRPRKSRLSGSYSRKSIRWPDRGCQSGGTTQGSTVTGWRKI